MAEKLRNDLTIAEFLRYKFPDRTTSPVYLLTPAKGQLNINDPEQQKRFNEKIYDILLQLKHFILEPPVVIKIHIGESSCNTRMLPIFTKGEREFLKKKEIRKVVYGDTTVVYSGLRGYRENGPPAQKYLNLAKKHGWNTKLPFVVLDRPETSDKKYIGFEQEQVIKTIENPGRFHDFSLSGGFFNCGSVLHNPHCTLHGLAHFALCVKGITMGLAGREGKLTMHQCYYPVMDENICTGCYMCVNSCPEDALQENQGDIPIMDKSRCIGCGECLASCPSDAIQMQGAKVTDWKKGTSSLPYRMIDYLMGIMNRRWQNMVNIAHLYNITPLCDCVDVKQKPICSDIGFLIGQNPLAVDNAARKILDTHLKAERVQSIMERYPSDNWQEMFRYARETYGIITEPEIIEIRV